MKKTNIKPRVRARCETIRWHPGMLVLDGCWVAQAKTADEHFAMLATAIILRSMIAGELGGPA